MGALIVQAVATYLTYGAGSELTAGISNTALKAATRAVVSQMISAAATSAITGNSLKLDAKSMIQSAVTAGVLSYAQGLTELDKLNQLNLGEVGTKIAKVTLDATIKSGVNSAINGTVFKNGFVNALIVDSAFKYIGHELYSENSAYKDVLPPKTVTHAILGGTVAKLQGGDFTSGAISTAVSHVTAEAMVNHYMDDVLTNKISEEELSARTKFVANLTSTVVNKIARPNQSDKDLNISNQIGQSNVENNSLKLITTAIKIARKIKKIEGKITKDKLKDIGLDEIADILEDGSTILDPSSSIAEKAMAAADLIIWTELNNKKTKVASKIDDKKFDNLAGTPLSKDVKAYAKDLEKIGNLKISSEQKDLLNNALKGKNIKS